LRTPLTKPDALKEEHLLYLDGLRESGVTHMWGARPYVQKKFPELSQDQACVILIYWMQTFSERHPKVAP